MKRKIKDRILIQLDYIWRNISHHASEWVPVETHRQAVTKYHAKAYTRRTAIVNRLCACIDIITNDLTDKFDEYLPQLCYITVILSRDINTGRKFVREILTSDLPLNPEALALLGKSIYHVNIECIDRRPKEV